MIHGTVSRRGVRLAAIGMFVPVAVIGLTSVAFAADPQFKTAPTLNSMPSSNLNNAHTGDTVSDAATVTGLGGITPTGTVTFVMYSGNTCSVGGTALETSTPAITLTPTTGGAATATYAFTTVLQAANGPYSVQATYGGDLNYNTKTGHCDVVTVNKANPTIDTTPTAVPPA